MDAGACDVCFLAESHMYFPEKICAFHSVLGPPPFLWGHNEGRGPQDSVTGKEQEKKK